MRRDNNIFINWEEVHAIKHGLHDNPHHILGPHMDWDGVVINAYVKDALKVEVIHRDTKESYEMRASGIADFFTVATGESSVFPYMLRATYRDGSTYEYVDAYSFEPVIDNMELAEFSQGIGYEIYKKLGAHPMTVDGVDGVLFAVWAPNAQRVSVVGEFNLWEGSRGLMRRLANSSVFELFVPGIALGATYKFEIRTYDGEIFLKSDPYAQRNEHAPSDASVVTDATHRFRDGKWIKNRDAACNKEKPMNICQVDLFSFARTLGTEETYKTIAKPLINYIKEREYRYVEFSPIMDYANVAAGGYITRGFYAVMSTLGSAADLKYLIDQLHQNEIGVLLDWAPNHFSKDDNGLYLYDGAAAYEDSNPLRADNTAFGTVNFNYGRKEVSNFLISNALYWVEEFHADGLIVSSVASMLYLDYGKNDGEWLPNIYGSNENLEAVEFFKHLNSIMKRRNKGVIMIADDVSLWPDVTKDVEEEGLGFDYKWNLGWSEDMMDYMSMDFGARRNNYNALTFSLLYAYNEQFMYGFSAKSGAKELYAKLTGNEIQKQASFKVLLGYLMMQPGKKYMSAAIEDAITNESVKQYIKDLQKLYVTEPALYKQDYEDTGFEWINTMKAKEGILVFARKTENKNDTLVVICNFSAEEEDAFSIGVPYAGKYKEIFNSDRKEYDGEGNDNLRMRQSKAQECDARENSIVTVVPAFGISVYKYNVAGTVKEKTEPKKTTTTKKTVAKKPVAAKKEAVPKKAVEEKKEAAPKKAVAAKKEAAPKKAVAAKKEPASKKAVAAKKEPAPKKAVEVKKEPAPKKAVEAKKEPAPKKAVETKKEAAPKKIK